MIRRTKMPRRNGFTLIELMLSMTFVALLLLGVAMTTIQIGNTYSKGVTLKAVNQAGRDFSDTLRRDISASSRFDLSTKLRYTPGENGRLCLGQYTYVWNEGPALAKNDASKLITYQKVGAGNPEKVVATRVADNGGLLCSVNGLPQVNKTVSSNLLGATSDSIDLAIQRFAIRELTADTATGQAVYEINFTISTNDQKALDSANNSCQSPGGVDNNFNFCAVNEFRFTARAAGSS